MKAVKYFAGVIALLSVLCCQKEEVKNDDNGILQEEIITCTFDANEDTTKTDIMGGRNLGTIYWKAGDEIMLYDGKSKTQKLILAESGTPSSETGVIKTFPSEFIFVKPAGWTKVYAIYPFSACVTDFSASAPKLNFAGQDGSFGKANISAAVAVSGDMKFKNVGSIFQIFYNNYTTLPEISSVEIPVSDLAKDFQLSFSGQTPSLTSVEASNSNVFSVEPWSNDTKYFGVPAGGSLEKGSAFIYRSSSKSIVGCQIFSKDTTLAVNDLYIFPYVKANGKLPGAFSVSDTAKVRFSRGNLRAKYKSSSWKWDFFDQQYEMNPYQVSAGSRTAAASDTLIDLFCWGYDAQGSINPVEATQRASFADWGTVISEGSWRSLSQAEWEYMINDGNKLSKARTQTNRFAKANVKGIKGLIIFPDGYYGTTAVSGVSGIAEVNSTSAAFPTASIDSDVWMSMESKGCVFLPASGSRYSSSVGSVGVEGYYWSSSPGDNTNSSWTLTFGNAGCSTKAESENDFSCSVRLVTPAN